MLSHVVYTLLHLIQILKTGHLTQDHTVLKMSLAKLKHCVNSKALAPSDLPGTLVLRKGKKEVRDIGFWKLILFLGKLVLE